MIKGINAVIELLEQNRCPYWKIMAEPKGIVKTRDNSNDFAENYPLRESLSFLQSRLEALEPGKYWISFWDKPESKNTYLGEWFLIGNPDVKQISGVPDNAMDIDSKIERAVLKEREKWQAEENARNLEKDNNSLKEQLAAAIKEKNDAIKERDDNWTKFIKNITPYVGAVIQGLTGAKPTPAIAGTNENKGTNIVSDVINDRINDALESWSKTESEETIALLIEKIAVLTTENPSLYNMAKDMLLK